MVRIAIIRPGAPTLRATLDNGVYLSPSQFEANFVSIQHTEEYLSDVLEIAKGY